MELLWQGMRCAMYRTSWIRASSTLMNVLMIRVQEALAQGGELHWEGSECMDYVN